MCGSVERQNKRRKRKESNVGVNKYQGKHNSLRESVSMCFDITCQYLCLFWGKHTFIFSFYFNHCLKFHMLVFCLALLKHSRFISSFFHESIIFLFLCILIHLYSVAALKIAFKCIQRMRKRHLIVPLKDVRMRLILKLE